MWEKVKHCEYFALYFFYFNTSENLKDNLQFSRKKKAKFRRKPDNNKHTFVLHEYVF